MIPAFGKGQECSFGAALKAALQALKVETDYEHVMGVSGACYRLAFCSPGWDYSSVDGLVAYDYATWAYQTFVYLSKNKHLLQEKAEEMNQIEKIFGELSDKAQQIHAMCELEQEAVSIAKGAVAALGLP